MGRRRKTLSKGPVSKGNQFETKYVICSKCGVIPMKIDGDCVSGVCWLCATKMVEPPTFVTYKKSDKPRGWHLRKVFVDKKGNVYHKGIEQKELKGTLKPTKLEKKNKKKRITKRQKIRESDEASAKIFDLKKKLKNEKRKTYKRKIELDIKKLQKKVISKF